MRRRAILSLGLLALPRPSRAADGEMLALAQMAYGEARGQPMAGRLAVMQVALNRQAGRHPGLAADRGTSLHQVVSRRGQFLGWRPRLRVDAAELRHWVGLADVATSLWHAGVDLSDGAVWFNRGGRPEPGARETVRIAQHVFWTAA